MRCPICDNEGLYFYEAATVKDYEVTALCIGEGGKLKIEVSDEEPGLSSFGIDPVIFCEGCGRQYSIEEIKNAVS